MRKIAWAIGAMIAVSTVFSGCGTEDHHGPGDYLEHLGAEYCVTHGGTWSFAGIVNGYESTDGTCYQQPGFTWSNY